MSTDLDTLATALSVRTDDVWVVDSTPLECARSRETVKRSDLAGWAQYGYCAHNDATGQSVMRSLMAYDH